MLLALNITANDLYVPSLGSWLYCLLPAAVACLWLWPVGYTYAKAIGLPRRLAFAFAPIATTGFTALAGILFAQFHIPYRPLTIGALFTVLTLLSYLWARKQGRWVWPGWTQLSTAVPRFRKRGFYAFLPGIAFLVLVLNIVFSYVRAIPAPGWFTQTYDSSFHLANIKKIVAFQDGSSLHSGMFPMNSPIFYPSAWHDVTALISNVSLGSVTTATNVMVLITTVLIWPFGVYTLAREISTHRHIGWLSLAFCWSLPQFPLTFLWYGTITPNMLAYSFLPAVLAIYLYFWKNWQQHWKALLGAAWIGGLALLLTQPNAVFSFILLACFATFGLVLRSIFNGEGAARWATRLPRFSCLFQRRWALSLLAVLGLCLVLVIISLGIDQIGQLRSMRRAENFHPDTQSVVSAVVQVLALSAGRFILLLPLFKASSMLPFAIIMLLGVVYAIWKREVWPILFSYLGAVIFFIAVQTTPRRIHFYLGGIWYTDPPRIIAISVIPGVILLACAGCALFDIFGRLTSRVTATNLIAVVLILVIVEGTFTSFNTRYGFQTVKEINRIDTVSRSRNQILDQDELKLFLRLPKKMPSDARVIGDPWLGANYVWPLAGIKTVFPRIESEPSSRQRRISFRFNKPKYRRQLCKLLKQYRIEYYLSLQTDETGDLLREKYEKNFHEVSLYHPERYGQLIDQEGRAKLYKLTICEKPLPHKKLPQ